MDLQSLFTEFEWFRRLPAKPREAVLRTSQMRHFGYAEFIAHRGFAVAHWIGVSNGLLKASTSSVEGKQFSEVLASTGEWTGEVEILLDRCWCYDVVAIEPSTVVLVSAQTFKWLVADDIMFANFAMRQLAARSAAAMERLERPRQPAGISAVAHAVAELLVRVMRRDPESSATVVRLSQSQIAEMVRLSRQTVNQGLRLLEKRGLVCVGYNKIEIRNEVALKACVVFDELSEVRQSSRVGLPSI